jgi:hypothetical protein
MAHMGLIKIMDRFGDEESCQTHLFNLKWPAGFVCPRCKGTECYCIQDRGLFQCKNKKCRYQASLTAGTIFHKTRISLRKWFLAIHLMTSDKRGYSAKGLEGQLEINHTSAWLLFHKLRDAMASRDSSYRLYGHVQLDEAFFGAPDGLQGRGTNKAKVFVAVSADADGRPWNVKMQVADAVNSLTALEFAEQNISKGCRVITDKLNIYPILAKNGYTHEAVRSSSAEAEVKLKWVHVLISNAKAAVTGTFHGLDTKHLQSYLDAFCYRFNRRYVTDIFSNLLNACISGPAITYRDLAMRNLAELTA